MNKWGRTEPSDWNAGENLKKRPCFKAYRAFFDSKMGLVRNPLYKYKSAAGLRRPFLGAKWGL
jgi:hypothetical protein